MKKAEGIQKTLMTEYGVAASKIEDIKNVKDGEQKDRLIKKIINLEKDPPSELFSLSKDLSIEKVPERNKSLWSRLNNTFKKDKPTQDSTTPDNITQNRKKINLCAFSEPQESLANAKTKNVEMKPNHREKLPKKRTR
ncbi:hypothetical protein [Zobellia galactanivorans]|uniref:Uncharacterized protein n=1 Tax=Zobellia galactanivorans (strain DSM 12802 / CCUG 47099 / CIP 106680 / NCIMB 13871 / Dsij) TaxID=63186 RepID=G0L781_ZOBGA|nr:hypothetical protein [Zobellia galactanivorans]CAZ97212.1 Hypothetical protein ZOBELLIA_3073 [Zobellia galactanivorans]